MPITASAAMQGLLFYIVVVVALAGRVIWQTGFLYSLICVII